MAKDLAGDLRSALGDIARAGPMIRAGEKIGELGEGLERGYRRIKDAFTPAAPKRTTDIALPKDRMRRPVLARKVVR